MLIQYNLLTLRQEIVGYNHRIIDFTRTKTWQFLIFHVWIDKELFPTILNEIAFKVPYALIYTCRTTCKQINREETKT